MPDNIYLEDIIKIDIEERVYKFRCVEAWSMIVLSKVLNFLN